MRRTKIDASEVTHVNVGTGVVYLTVRTQRDHSGGSIRTYRADDHSMPQCEFSPKAVADLARLAEGTVFAIADEPDDRFPGPGFSDEPWTLVDLLPLSVGESVDFGPHGSVVTRVS